MHQSQYNVLLLVGMAHLFLFILYSKFTCFLLLEYNVELTNQQHKYLVID